MRNYFTALILIVCASCQKKECTIGDIISFEISTYQDNNRTKASAMPVLKADSTLFAYKMRFDYLLLNIPEIFQPYKLNARDSINSLYPDSSRIKQIYLDHFCRDKKLVKYFEETYNAIKDPNQNVTLSYTIDELMNVSSKFFYCDQLLADTIVQSHVCIGLNGIKEAKWDKDYTLLSAFCLEAIFNDLNKDPSQIDEVYSIEKKMACVQFKKNITTLDNYLENVRLDLFKRMENNALLKEKLLQYYELNKNNLAFKINK